jgi:hypothetical protein
VVIVYFQINICTPSGDRAAVVAGVLVVLDFLVAVVETLMVVLDFLAVEVETLMVLVDSCVVILDSCTVVLDSFVLDSSVVALDSSVFEFAGSVMADIKAENVSLVDVSFLSGIFPGAYTETGGAIARVFDG